jgi:hypothetical protein
MRAIALLCALALLAGIVTSVATTRAGASDGAAPAVAAAKTAKRIGHYRQVTWHWQRVMGKPRTPASFSARRSPDPDYRRWVLKLWQRRAHRVERQAAAWLAGRIRGYQARALHWERVMGLRRGPLRQTASISSSLRQRHASMRHWRRRALRLERRAAHPPFEAAWRCIHRYEGSWSDGGGPYYGGLQMDISFQRSYGRYLLETKGTADRWTPAEQMWVAARALRSGRGFYPWPNTARACGLL